jgi:hypothetical protein
MAFLNRCIWTAASSGTGSFVVSAAAQNGYTPANCTNPSVVDGATYHYFATDSAGNHEEGDGVWTIATSTLTRATIRNSSNSGLAVSFPTAPTVFMGGPIATDMAMTKNVSDTTASTVVSGNAVLDYNINNADSWTITTTSNGGLWVQSANTQSTGINMVNTTTGAHSFSFFATGSGNVPGRFGVYDITQNATWFGLDGTTNGNLLLTENAVMGWSADPQGFTGVLDTGLARNAAAVVEVNNGTKGTLATIIAASILGGSVSGGVGYATGKSVGGTVTQATSKSTGVTINTLAGKITTASVALAAGAKVSFTVTNSRVAAVDVPVVAVASGGTANAYRANVAAVAAGSFAITLENITAGSLTEQPVISFAIIKGTTS